MTYKTGLASIFTVHARSAGSPQPPTQTCPHCQSQYTLGVDGTVDGCDDCTGIVRDRAGFAWDADDQEQSNG